MKERPILFSGPMVRALLNGSKTQTRRAVRPQPRRVDGGVPFGDAPAWAHAEPGSMMIGCPYGKRGDRLWVRGKFAIVPRTAYAHSEGVQQTPWPNDPFDHDTAIYAAGWIRSSGGIRWRPSIHMPRWASRILLEVSGVRVERLQDISIEDAIAEGCPGGEHGDRYAALEQYMGLWKSINGPGSWDANPWVWVVEFKRVGAA